VVPYHVDGLAAHRVVGTARGVELAGMDGRRAAYLIPGFTPRGVAVKKYLQAAVFD
jgi:hypothetical protein